MSFEEPISAMLHYILTLNVLFSFSFHSYTDSPEWLGKHLGFLELGSQIYPS